MDLTPLHAPVSAESPCGPDPDFDPALYAQWSAFKAAVETQNSKWTEYLSRPAEEKSQVPTWAGLQQAAYQMAATTKHLYAAAILTECLALTEGLPGLRDGLRLIHKWCSDFWKPLHPHGDEDSDTGEIAALRRNSALHFEAPPVIARLLRLPLAATWGETKGRKYLTAGPYNLADHQAAKENQLPPEEARLVLATFEKADQADLRTTHAAISSAMEAARNLEAVFESHGVDLSLTSLRDYLFRAGNAVRSCLRDDTANEENPGGEELPDARAGFSAGGAVASRQAALAALDKVIAYFETAEPSSPVPLMLRRAQRCVGRSFLEIVDELGQDRTLVEQILKPASQPASAE